MLSCLSLVVGTLFGTPTALSPKAPLSLPMKTLSAILANAELYPLSSVRITDGPFKEGLEANRKYMLALDTDRLLAPFFREAGLTPKKPSYGNWENIGLDGHIAGHYLSALSDMIASGSDTPNGEFRRRLQSMIQDLAVCQKASGDGYIGGIPGGREWRRRLAEGHVEAVFEKWAPWYNLHKTFAGLRDAYLVGGNTEARGILIRYADWVCGLLGGLTDEQVQAMLRAEHGGMNEVLADVFGITGDPKYLTAAKRFSDHAILDPLTKQEDRLTGLHANTQIPKVIGFARIASLKGGDSYHSAADFFWSTVTSHRTVAFGGNSVSEHFNDPKDFRGMLEHREGPESCNTYNMLRLTERLFTLRPEAGYADYYERALYNHILASINTKHPGFVYFTPIRPGHYRVFSQPDKCFWCCVGTGMENPGRYSQFVYAKAPHGVFVNLFIPSELNDSAAGIRLVQKTSFPETAQTHITVKVSSPKQFAIYLRHPAWASERGFVVKVNGTKIATPSTPASYVPIQRTWKDGDRIEVSLPMQPHIEDLPDHSGWIAMFYGPILLAYPTGTQDQVGLIAGDGRGDHIAHGPLIPMDLAPSLLTTAGQVPGDIVTDHDGQPLHFRISKDIVPSTPGGLNLVPFYKVGESRYQIYWELVTKQSLLERKERLAAEEREKLARDAATLDVVAVGEQQPEVDHSMVGENMETGIFDGRRWRHGQMIQYSLKTKNAPAVDLAVTYSGSDSGRVFDILVNGVYLATQELKGDKAGRFFEVRYPIPENLLKSAKDQTLVVRFVAKQWLAGGLYDVRLYRATLPR